MDIAEDAFERMIERMVEREFNNLRALPDAVCEVPFIGGPPFDHYGQFNPHLPPEQHADLRQRVLRALRARRWFEFEAPPWAQPLPLKLEDCYALFNDPPHRGKIRPALVGEYGICLRGMDWRLEYAPPFEEFCAEQLSPRS
jgi:hypothetical protein